MFTRFFHFFRQDLSISQALLGFSFFLGIIFVLVVPPFQKADEDTHFYKAVSVASGHFICQKDQSGVFENYIPKRFVDFPVRTFAKSIHSDAHFIFPRSFYLTLLSESSGDRSFVNEPSSCSLPFLLYLPLAAVLFLPIQLGANPLIILFLGRLIQFLLAFGLFVMAYKVAPKKTKLVPLFILSLPIVLYQISSFSKDALHISCGVLSFCYLLSFWEKKQFKLKTVINFFIVTAIAILARPQYLLFTALVFLVPFHKVKKYQLMSQALSLLFIIFIFSIIGILLTFEVYSAKASSLGNLAPNVYVYPNVQFQFLKEHLDQAPTVVLETFETQSVFYLKSAIGFLGWFEYGLPWYVYLFYLLLGAYVFIKSKDDFPILTPFHFFLLNGVIWGTITAILLSFYLYASPVGGPIVLGVQGRYFLILIPYLFWIFATFFHYFKSKFILVGLGLILFSTTFTVLMRYYDTSHHYYRSENSSIKIDMDQFKLLTQETHQPLKLEEGKKLRGMSIFTPKTEFPVTKPYRLRILDETCTTVLREAIISAKSYKENNWTDVLVNPLTNPHVCVSISPYYLSVPEKESMKVLIDKSGDVLLLPIYLN